MHRLMVRTVGLALLAICCLIPAPTARSARQAPNPQSRITPGTAVVHDVYGPAQRKVGSGDWKNISVGDVLPDQTTIKTGEEAAVLLRLVGGNSFRIGENSTVQLK